MRSDRKSGLAYILGARYKTTYLLTVSSTANQGYLFAFYALHRFHQLFAEKGNEIIINAACVAALALFVLMIFTSLLDGYP